MDGSTDGTLVQPAKRHKPDRNETDDTVVAAPQTPGGAPIAHTGEQMSPRLKNLSNMEKNDKKFEDGYDSDGDDGPFYDVTSIEGKQFFEEDDDDGNIFVPERAIDDIVAVDDAIVDVAEKEEEEVGVHVPIDEVYLKNMKGAQLKEELRLRYESTSGIKTALLKRLKKALLEEKPKYSIEYIENEKIKKKEAAATKKPSGLDKFSDGAYWQQLAPKESVVEEPNNELFSIARAPTVPERDAHLVPVKHNFDEQFDIPPFSGKAIVFELTQPTRNNPTRRIKLDREKNPITKEVARTEGIVRPEFIKANGLSKDSYPHDFANCFIPLFSKRKTAGPESFSIHNMMQWTNLKAVLADAGSGGSYYPNFKPFKTKEIRQHLGLYILQGLSPSPQIEQKFRHQESDPVNGNDYAYKAFANKGSRERRHKEFKSMLAVQDPRIDTPPREDYPNWKIRPLLQWMNYIGPFAWMLGPCFSIDEMTLRFKGQHKDKRRITYKAEGDGFQCDALCQEGYCYQHYFRNDPAPKKYINQGLSPLHSRCMWLFDSVEDLYHQCSMDNLYNSANFCYAGYKHPKKLLTHGVTRKGGRGLPACVIQQEAKTRNEERIVRGTVKAAHLKGDDSITCLVASSVYDTKPVHYLSMVSIRLEWIVVEREVYNVDTGRKEVLRFLRLNFINNYNHTMGHVDVADQLRGSYRIDIWIRNRKWWWSFLFWSIGTLLTNSYKVYIKVNLAEGVDKKKLLSHYNYRKQIALHWMNPDLFEVETVTVARKRKRDEDSPSFDSPSSVSRITTASSHSRRRSPKFTDNSLHEDGCLKVRLQRQLGHFPSRPCNKNSRCLLHGWAGSRKEGELMFCETCNVHLCIDCFNIFHTRANLVDIKKELAKEYKE
jgi:hypothetical protein